MERALRYVIVFLWCVGFGFFSVMGYLGDPMTAQKSTAVLAGLLVGLGVYGAIEWRPKITGLPSIPLTLPTWASLKKRFLPTGKPSVSSKNP